MGITRLTQSESQQLENIAAKGRKVKEFLEKHPVPGDSSILNEWYRFLNGMKGIAGNANNDISFVAR